MFFLIIFLFIVIWVVCAFVQYNNKINTPPKSAPKNDYTIKVNQSAPVRFQDSELDREINLVCQDQEENEKAHDLLEYKWQKMETALFRRNYEKAMEIFYDMMTSTDPKIHATARHFIILRVIEKLYMLRDENPDVYDMCLDVCSYDINNMENFIEQDNRTIFGNVKSRERLECPFYLVTPTRAAIILEKKGDLVSAIGVCDLAIKWNALDLNGKRFDERKARLEKKLQKEMS